MGRTYSEEGRECLRLDAEREQRIQSIVDDVVSRMDRGEAVDEARCIAAHPDVAQELAKELHAVRQIRAARIAAAKAGPVAASAPQQDEVLPSPDRLDASSLFERTSPWASSLPMILGYGLVREINSGGQASVFEAKHEATGRHVAVKILSGGPFASSSRRARFAREARVLARLDHPNIVDVLDVGRTDNGSFFLAMRYVEGVPLDEYVATTTAAAATAANQDEVSHSVLQLFAKVARAAGEAHRRGVVHRDLKPANVRVDQRGEPHLLDFGLATLTEQGTALSATAVTHTGQIMGSLPWASPEQAAGAGTSLDARCDVYAIAVEAYHALTGSYPYRVFGRVTEVLHNIQHAAPAAPSTLRKEWSPKLAAAIDAVLIAALAKDRRLRYRDGIEFADELERCAAGLPTTVRPLREPRRPQRRRLVSATFYLTVVATGVAVTWHQYRAAHPSQFVLVADLPRVTNTAGMDLICIPAGSFIMGSTRDEPGRHPDETEHSATIPAPFWMARTEVTRKQFADVMGLPAPAPAAADLPVGSVTWDDAQQFCARLAAREGHRYRLPKESEWEYACRAGSNQMFGGAGRLRNVCWSASEDLTRPAPAGQKSPNAWGLHDMLGNVREWVEDGWYAGKAPTADEQALRHRYARGGGFRSAEGDCRASTRHGLYRHSAADDLGFRVVRDD